MTAFVGGVLFIGSMIVLLKGFGLFPRSLQAVHTSRSAFDAMRDPKLEDCRKEELLQGYSLSLLRSFLDLLIRGVGAIAIPIGVLWVLELVNVLSLKAVLDLTLSWPFLVGGSIVAIGVLWLFEK